jgi:hypothetical protein
MNRLVPTPVHTPDNGPGIPQSPTAPHDQPPRRPTMQLTGHNRPHRHAMPASRQSLQGDSLSTGMP